MLAKTETEIVEKVNAEARRISAPKLKKLMAAKRGAMSDMDSIRGTIGQKIGEAVEKENLDKKMFGWICQLDKMTPETLALRLDNLHHMLDASGLNERASSAPRFAAGEPADEE